jgi:hypothetical protein
MAPSVIGVHGLLRSLCRILATVKDSQCSGPTSNGTPGRGLVRAWCPRGLVAYDPSVAARQTRVDAPPGAPHHDRPDPPSPSGRVLHRRNDGVLAAATRLASVPAVLGLLGAAVAGAFAIVHLLVAAKGNLPAFILVGAGHASPAHVPAGITVYHEGYDGQFYYRLALDPLQWSHRAFGITFDSSYRIARITYPALAWLLAAGHHDVVPVTLVVVNVGAFGVLTGCACALAREAGRHPAWGLLVPAYWGYLWTIARDLTEVVAAALLVGALLAIRRRRPVVAAVCLSAGVLARETLLVLVAAVAVARLIGWMRTRSKRTTAAPQDVMGDLARGGPGVTDLVWLAPVVVFAGWELAVNLKVGGFPILASASTNRGVPFAGIVHAIGHYAALFPDHAALTWFADLAVLGVVVLSALVVLPSSRALLHEKLAWAGYLVLSLSLSDSI